MTNSEQPTERPTGTIEAESHRDRGVVGDPDVLRQIGYLSDQDEKFREHRPEPGDEDYFDFEEHRRHLSELRQALDGAGLSEEDRRMFDQFYGFQREGREPIGSIAAEHSRTAKEVGDFIRDVSQKLTLVSWQIVR